MRRYNLGLVRHAESFEHLGSVPHGLPIGLAAHDDPDKRRHSCLVVYWPCASEYPGFPSKLRRLSVFTMSRPWSRMRPSSATVCFWEVPFLEVKRQRKLSVHRVSDIPSGQTFTPRLSIMVSSSPSALALEIDAARSFGISDGQAT